MDKSNPICLSHSGLEAKIDALCKKIDLRFDAIDHAVTLAKSEMDRRLEAMNEFRAQLSSQATTFITRKEVELLLDKIQAHFDMVAQHNRDRIDSLDKSVAERTGAKKWSDHIITAMIAMAIFFLSHYLLKY